LNFSWSLLLLTVSGLVLYAAVRGSAEPFARCVWLAVGLFWMIHGGYVLISNFHSLQLVAVDRSFKNCYRRSQIRTPMSRSEQAVQVRASLIEERSIGRRARF
jgi:hypothetical protein